MTEFKKGDRVKVEFEGTIMYEDWDGTFRVEPEPGSPYESVYLVPEHMIKIAPALPTKVGSVIDSAYGTRFILTTNGWHATIDKTPYALNDFEKTSYAKDFTVVLEGK